MLTSGLSYDLGAFAGLIYSSPAEVKQFHSRCPSSLPFIVFCPVRINDDGCSRGCHGYLLRWLTDRTELQAPSPRLTCDELNFGLYIF